MSVEVNLFLYLLNEMVEAVTPAEWRDPDHLCVCGGGAPQPCLARRPRTQRQSWSHPLFPGKSAVRICFYVYKRD